jgi:hypothetical protein
MSKPTKQELIDHVESLVAKCAELTRERDEARREVCAWQSGHYGKSFRDTATVRGWNCFKDMDNA